MVSLNKKHYNHSCLQMAKWVIIVDDKSVEMMDMLDRSCWHQLELSIDFRIGK